MIAASAFLPSEYIGWQIWIVADNTTKQKMFQAIVISSIL